jgi:dephospho-CoA kinase
MNIGIIGKLGSGKTFAANHIIEKYGFQRISLATPIKDIMGKYFKVYDKTDPRYRRLAQQIGTDWFRSENPDIWIDYMIDETKFSDLSYVCDDVRFVNEATKLLKNGWILFYLDCPEQIRIERCTLRDGAVDITRLNHPSETGVDDILKEFEDEVYKIDSSGSIENTNCILDTWIDLFLRQRPISDFMYE